MRLHFRSDATAGAFTLFKPEDGPWSQITPALRRNGNQVEVSALAPNWLGSTKDETLPIVDLIWQHGALSSTESLLDSLSVLEALAPDGSALILPSAKIVTVGIKGKVDSRQAPQFKLEGRTRRVSFLLAKASQVELTVQNMRGQTVTSVFKGKMSAGLQEVAWDGSGEQGQPLTAGIYFMKLRAGAFHYDRKVEVLP
jgi:hypothetical protein